MRTGLKRSLGEKESQKALKGAVGPETWKLQQQMKRRRKSRVFGVGMRQEL
jgi:hypothetical protein